MNFKIELIVIIVVIIAQLYHSFNAYKNIHILKNIFTNFIIVKNGYIERQHLENSKTIKEHIFYFSDNENEDISNKFTVKISTTDTKGTNEIIIRINDAINSYLVNNYGAAVNFSIIKDMLDREVDAKDEEISQSIPIPLYLGLAATMVGIIFGLLAMPHIGGNNFSEGINALINGVKIAMFASLTGLACTTLLSSIFYKNAKKQSLKEKNQQLSYLQAKLLPELLKAEDTGVSGLKQSLDRFAREATNIAENVNNAAIQTEKNIRAQQATMESLERINITKVSKVNLELFGRLETNMRTFEKFSDFLDLMTLISDNLKNFAERTVNIDGIAGQIKSTLNDSNDLTKFLTAHFEKIESAGLSARRAVDLSESHFTEVIDLLKTRIDESMQSFSAFVDQKESDLKESLEKMNDDLTETSSKHIDQFTVAYSNAVPQFQQLDKLETLVLIKDTVDSKTKELIENSNTANNNIINKLNELGNRLNGNSANHGSTENLEYAIKELTKQLTGNGGISTSRIQWVKRAEPILRLIAWGCVITISVGLILIYFKVL